MTTVALIAADNIGYGNTGMVTVDLAAAATIKRISADAKIDFYTLHPPDRFAPISKHVDASSLPFRWLPLLESLKDVYEHDLIVFWGDFLQARHYMIEDAQPRMREAYGMSERESRLSLYRSLLLSDAPVSVLKKVVVFGSTILFNRQADYAEDSYGEHFSRLFSNARLALMREPISAAKVATIRGGDGRSCLGTDAALLLRDDDLRSLPITNWSRDLVSGGAMGVFFGVRTEPPRHLETFCEELAKQCRVEMEWVPWFPVHEQLERMPLQAWLKPQMAYKMTSYRSIIRGLLKRGGEYSVGDLLAALPKYKFIVTDTYHLCVNAWRAGVPAICFGTAEASTGYLTVNDFKKRILYGMYDATDFHRSTTSIDKKSDSKLLAQQLARIVTVPAEHLPIVERIRRHARDVESMLATGIG